MKRRKRKYARVTGQAAIKMMARVRGRNNRNWMALLSLAVKAKPKRARKIIKRIHDSDKEISKWLSRV